MAVETKEELEHKIAKKEEELKRVQDKENPDQRVIAYIELEISRLKNLKGDEGIHPQSAIKMPEATSFDAENAPPAKNLDGEVVDRKDPLGTGDSPKTEPKKEPEKKEVVVDKK